MTCIRVCLFHGPEDHFAITQSLANGVVKRSRFKQCRTPAHVRRRATIEVVLQAPGGFRCSCLYRPAVCRWNEGADDTAFRSQRPRCHSKTSKEERGEDVKGVSAVTADRSAGCGRACQVEEDAGIRPFLEPRKTRTSMAMAPSTFQNPRMAKKYIG